mmetsp:Transcript_92516/g.238847  ORF Transcript_92516/g.238847 Transcript_92516/m.238847 type:complete len:213 (+) Transcript_92516:214-852(+)
MEERAGVGQNAHSRMPLKDACHGGGGGVVPACWEAAAGGPSLRGLDDLVHQGGTERGLRAVPLRVLRRREELGQDRGGAVLVQRGSRHKLHGGDLGRAAAAAIGRMVEEEKAVRDEVVLVVGAIAHRDHARLQLRDDQRVVVGDRERPLRAGHGHAVHGLGDADGLGRRAHGQQQAVRHAGRLGEAEQSCGPERHGVGRVGRARWGGGWWCC